MKQKMNNVTKVKLIYSGELILISLVFLVVGTLRLLGVITPNPTFALVFNWITLFGGLWIIVDLIWGIVSKKRRQRICLLDKILNAPAGLTLIVFDILCLIGIIPGNSKIRVIIIACVFIYIGIVYAIQGIYHFKHPLPELLKEAEKADEEEKLEKEKKELEEKEKSEDKENL